MTAHRVRRSLREAQLLILQAAERLLVEGGPRAVQVRAVAQRVGMTDSGVTHHFGSREGLHVALLHHGGRRLREAVERATCDWVGEGASVAELVDCIADVYADGYGELAIALHAAGWRDAGGGMLAPVVEALHNARSRAGGREPERAETRLAVAALHQALATEPSYGSSFRRSAGIAEPEADHDRDQRRWWVNTLVATLGVE